MKEKIVIIEDNISLNEVLTLISKELTLNAKSYFNAEDFFKTFKLRTNCIYLIDKNLPGISGIEVVKRIRSIDPLSPIFIISAEDRDDDIYTALMAGADDYIVKPFNPEHLRLKLQNAKLKSRSIQKININQGLKFMSQNNIVLINGDPLCLSPNEFITLETIANNEGSVASKDTILQNLGRNVEDSSIDFIIHGLRKKLSETYLGIKNIRGIGYKAYFEKV